MSNTDKFEKCLEIGSKGEILCYQALKKFKNVKHILDVSKDEHFQDLDVDFIITNTDGRTLWIESKFDSHTDGCFEPLFQPTGNIVYETESNGNEGCLARSKANVVFYITTKNIYAFDLKEMRSYLSKVKPKAIKMGDGAMGYLLKVDDLLEASILKKLGETS